MSRKQTCTVVWIASAMTALLMTLSMATFADTFQQGPLSPEFQAWLETKDAAATNYGYIPSPVDWSHLKISGEKAASIYAARFDWRDTNSLTPVKYQDDCGACWAFAACGVLEAWSLIHEEETWDFSENHMKNTHGFVWDPCAGGNNDIATAYLARWTGPVSEEDDPYNPDAHTSPLNVLPRKRLWSAPVFVDLQNGEGNAHDPIKAAILEHGPVSAAMTWSDIAFNTAASTYYYSGFSPQNHVITIVGWDNNKAVPGAPGIGAWICKNSWSESWGESGYFYISYYDTKACKEATGFYSLTDPYPSEYVYHYDPLGLTMYTGTGSTNVAYAANVFQARANETLVAVGTYALADDTAYEIIIYNSGLVGTGFANPVATVSGTLENAGYHMIPLPGGVPVTEGNTFTVRVKYTTPGWQHPIPVEAPIAGYAAPTAATGQSFISGNGNYFEDIQGYYAGGNVCIKAFAGYIAPPVPTVRIVGSPHAEIGTRVVLSSTVTNMTGTVTYAWFKDGTALPGAIAPEYIIPELEESHAGSYVLEATDESKGIYTSPPFVLEVLPEGALPVSGALQVAALALLAAGTLTLRRRFRPVTQDR